MCEKKGSQYCVCCPDQRGRKRERELFTLILNSCGIMKAFLKIITIPVKMIKLAQLPNKNKGSDTFSLEDTKILFSIVMTNTVTVWPNNISH